MNETMNQEVDPMTLAALASELATEAHEEFFHFHWGLGPLADPEGKPLGFYIFDNHPYANDDTKRPHIYSTLRTLLESNGCKQVAEAAYPAPSEGEEQPGYTIAVLYRCADVDAGLSLAKHYLDALRWSVECGRGNKAVS